jgi:putative SOS response-associated peptidase YedK
MCGRYALRRINLVRAVMEAMPALPFDEFTERPRFNVAPTQTMPIAKLDADGNRVLLAARWGFVPGWTKGKPKTQPINARSESAPESPMFRNAFNQQRCLIPADGFYEWKGVKPPHQPYFIHFKDDSIFTFAGLCSRWKPDENSPALWIFTILTTAPNEIVKPIHNRMPVILRRDDFAKWLNSRADSAKELLKPCHPEQMDAYPISSRINRPTEDGAEVIEPTES